MMSPYLTLFLGNSTRLELRKLAAFDAVDSFSYVNDAAVSATLLDDAGAPVAGQVWPLTLSYETGSNGDYAGVVIPGISVTEGDKLTAEIEAVSGNDRGFWDVPVEVVRRTHRSGYG